MDYKDLERDDGHRWREDDFRTFPETAVERALILDGKRLESQEEWDSAYGVYREAVRRFRLNPSGWEALARTAEKLGRPDEAKAARDRCTQLRVNSK